MADQLLSRARDHVPWRAETPWWVAGLQGIVLVVIGVYLLAAPDAAGRLLLQLVALVVLIQSISSIVAGFRAPRGTVNPYVMVRSGVGATIGLLVVFRSWLVPSLDLNSARVILGLGLLAFVLIEVVDALADPDRGERWLGRGVNAVLLLVLAILLLTSGDENAADRLAVLAWVMIVGGILALLVAWRGYSRATSAPTATAPPR